MKTTIRENILRFAASRSIFRPRDIPSSGSPRKVIGRMVEEGTLVRLGPGMYSLADADFGAKVTLAEASVRIPGGVICLLSALRFHELTTENPSEVWMAVGHKRPLRVDAPPVHVVRMSGKAFESGIEEHEIEGVSVRVFSVAKTIADCFKFRSRVGIDVATEALRDGWRRRAFEMDDLWREAETCRVLNLMRPYLEML